MSRDTYFPKHKYTGNNTLDQYTFTFKITNLNQLLVVVADLSGAEVFRVRGTDTTVFLTGVAFDPIDGGGTIHLQSILPTGWKLQILLADDAPVQQFKFRDKTSFTLRKFEEALDFVMGVVQRLTYRASQAIRIHDLDDETTFNPQLPPDIANQQERMIIVNAAGDGVDYGMSMSEIASAISGSGLPPGGTLGDFLEQDVASVVWKAGAYQGFSARFGVMWNSTGLKDTIDKILNITYAPPTISLSASPAQSIREKGTVVPSVNLSATTTKLSNNILRVFFYRAGVLINTIDPATPGGAVETYTSSTPFSDTMTFTAQVEDGASTVNSNTVTYNFVYPYYYGARPPGATAAQIAALTKLVIAQTRPQTRSFTAAGGDVFYFAYPSSYSALASILDQNGFETIGSWTVTTKTITGLDGNAVSYRCYAYNNVQAAGTSSFTFN
jgi:hypothetical protein